MGTRPSCTQRKESLKEITLFVAVGIDLEGIKEILGFWIFPGKETKKAWAEVFQDLVNRRVKRVLVLVTGDFPGVEELIGKLFPFADQELPFCTYSAT